MCTFMCMYVDVSVTIHMCVCQYYDMYILDHDTKCSSLLSVPVRKKHWLSDPFDLF